MGVLGWIILGFGLGVIAMLPIAQRMRLRAEKRARQAERRARDAERLAELGSMTGGLAHEIKNPLSTVGLNAQLLSESIAESEMPAEQRERMLRRIDTLSREIERLRGILTDFLQFAGRMKLDPQPRDLNQIVDELSDFFHPQCQQAGVTLRTQIAREPLMVKVDEGLIKQAVLNLMLNAVQAMSNASAASSQSGDSARGELILRVEGDEQEVCLHVIDTGPGIPTDRIDQIFRPYVSHRAGGTGLGLPTARRIVQEHGGDIEVHSELGKGSDFTVHLPLGAKSKGSK